jgi:DNA topoisomerase-6 subunit B
LELARVIRYANRVPLLYQQSACAIFKAVLATTWRNYGIGQSRGALPAGPMVIFVHIASVWVPFTSESKEAIAEYDEIHKDITLALRECGRRLGLFLRRRERAASEFRRRNIFELYIEEVAEACNRLKGGKLPTEKLKMQLQRIASSRTGGIKTDETLGKTGGGPEGLPHSIIVTAEGIDGEVPPTLDVSRTIAPAADVPGDIDIEEKQRFSKPGRKHTTKVRTGKKGIGKAATVPSPSKQGASFQQRAGAVRTGRKPHLTRKKK